MEPALSHPYSSTQTGAPNPYANRWRWWYAAIADWMLENPGQGMAECARSIGRSYAAVCAIAATDLFKAHLAIRRKEFEARRDGRMIEKLHKVADRSLDLVCEVLDSKRDKVPLQQLQSIAEGALDRLGYGPKPMGGTTINNNIVAANIRPQVTLEELEAARQSYRAIQEKNRTIEHQPGAGFEKASAITAPNIEIPRPTPERLPYDPLALADA